MKILIIGDYPVFFGGVTNYTRPLAEELSKYHDVYYLYSCTRTENFDFKRMRITKSVPIENSKVNFFELINPPTRYPNYHNLDLDTGNWLDEIFIKYLDEIKPDVIHIHEIFGFSSNLIVIAKSKGIKVFVTVHEYWWLCSHRVMIDFNKKICNGPEDISKCVHCVKRINFVPQSKIKIIVRKRVKWLHKIYMKFLKRQKLNDLTVHLDYRNEIYKNNKATKLYNILENRLLKNISYLNKCDLIIAVSSDVKKILSAYGVNPKIILVQHIGSTIANKKIVHVKKVDSRRIVFGFIGGVTYYKGVHQLVEAFLLLPEELKEKSCVEIWGKYDDGYVGEITNKFEKSSYFKNIKFHGLFTPKDIQHISNQIDISVLPSLCADTAPQTIFESFSSGLPIIAPFIGGFPDFIINGKNGLTYEAGEVEKLSQCLKKIIEEPGLIDKLRINIPKLKVIDQNVLELLDIYERESQLQR